VAAEFTQPWIFSPGTPSSAIFLERQSVPDVYIRRVAGAEPGAHPGGGAATPVTLSYQPQVGRLEAADVFFCTNFLVCNTDEIDVLASANVLAPLGLRFSRDRTNRAVAPTGGYMAAADLEHASRHLSAFDYEYARFCRGSPLQGAPPGDGAGGRLRGGWLGASAFRGFDGTRRAGIRIAPPQKRFYAGGANSVRGYAQNQLGPRVVTVGVEELLFPRNGDEAHLRPGGGGEPLLRRLGGGGGRLRVPPHRGERGAGGSARTALPGLGPLPLRGRLPGLGPGLARTPDAASGRPGGHAGVRIRYSTPIGPIRLDLAYRPAARQELPVVTSAIRPWEEGEDPEGSRILDPRTGERIDWVFVDALARLEHPRESFAESGVHLRRVQFQFSIGHAF
jgi:hypothetical protein